MQIGKHLLLCDICSQKGVDLLCVKRHSDWLFDPGIYIHHTIHNLTGSKLLNQLTSAVNSGLCIVGVKTLLKFTRSLGAQSYLLCGKADVYTVKAGGFKEHGFYTVRDHGIFTAHDSGYADGFLTVADHQYGIVHCPLLTV